VNDEFSGVNQDMNDSKNNLSMMSNKSKQTKKKKIAKTTKNI
jgi:hypothetical protein